MFEPGFVGMHHYNDRHEELLREAEKYRLVKEALKTGKPEVRLYSQILANFGRQLVALGTTLEKRYSTSSQPVWRLGQHGISDSGC